MNYWILQANPETYFIVHYRLDDRIKEHPDHEGWWGVENKFEGQFSKGDVVYIWKCQGEPKRKDAAPEYEDWKRRKWWTKGQRGIYAVGEVSGPARWHSFTEAEIQPFKKYYVDDTWKRGTKRRLVVFFNIYSQSRR